MGTLRIPKALLDKWGVAHKGRTPQQIADDIVAKLPAASVKAAAEAEEALYLQLWPEAAAEAPTYTAAEDEVYLAVWPEG